jgi:hypothetical protein
MTSPYHGLPINQWQIKTRQLIQEHPLNATELYHIVLQVWNDILQSKIGSKPFQIGVDIFPKPQIMGFFLHELIPLELSYRYPNIWRGETSSTEKDMVYIPDTRFSIEIKTSSSSRNIYGNRSYAQDSDKSKKDKSGYYLAINFEKFSPKVAHPQITQVRFGWIDHEDWQGQTVATGQQARLSSDVERYKLHVLPIIEE